MRNATLLLDTSVGRILPDPKLRAAGSSPPIEDTPNPAAEPARLRSAYRAIPGVRVPADGETIEL